MKREHVHVAAAPALGNSRCARLARDLKCGSSGSTVGGSLRRAAGAEEMEDSRVLASISVQIWENDYSDGCMTAQGDLDILAHHVADVAHPTSKVLLPLLPQRPGVEKCFTDLSFSRVEKGSDSIAMKVLLDAGAIKKLGAQPLFFVLHDAKGNIIGDASVALPDDGSAWEGAFEVPPARSPAEKIDGGAATRLLTKGGDPAAARTDTQDPEDWKGAEDKLSASAMREPAAPRNSTIGLADGIWVGDLVTSEPVPAELASLRTLSYSETDNEAAGQMTTSADEFETSDADEEPLANARSANVLKAVREAAEELTNDVLQRRLSELEAKLVSAESESESRGAELLRCKSELSEKSERLAQLESEAAALRKELGALRSGHMEHSALAAKDATIELLSSQNKMGEEAQQSARATIADLQSELSDTRRELSDTIDGTKKLRAEIEAAEEKKREGEAERASKALDAAVAQANALQSELRKSCDEKAGEVERLKTRIAELDASSRSFQMSLEDTSAQLRDAVAERDELRRLLRERSDMVEEDMRERLCQAAQTGQEHEEKVEALTEELEYTKEQAEEAERDAFEEKVRLEQELRRLNEASDTAKKDLETLLENHKVQTETLESEYEDKLRLAEERTGLAAGKSAAIVRANLISWLRRAGVNVRDAARYADDLIRRGVPTPGALADRWRQDRQARRALPAVAARWDGDAQRLTTEVVATGPEVGEEDLLEAVVERLEHRRCVISALKRVIKARYQRAQSESLHATGSSAALAGKEAARTVLLRRTASAERSRLEAEKQAAILNVRLSATQAALSAMRKDMATQLRGAKNCYNREKAMLETAKRRVAELAAYAQRLEGEVAGSARAVAAAEDEAAERDEDARREKQERRYLEEECQRIVSEAQREQSQSRQAIRVLQEETISIWLVYIGIEEAEARRYAESFVAAGITERRMITTMRKRALNEIVDNLDHRMIIADYRRPESNAGQRLYSRSLRNARKGQAAAADAIDLRPQTAPESGLRHQEQTADDAELSSFVKA